LPGYDTAAPKKIAGGVREAGPAVPPITTLKRCGWFPDAQWQPADQAMMAMIDGMCTALRCLGIVANQSADVGSKMVGTALLIPLVAAPHRHC
jgi:hypothetical protein